MIYKDYFINSDFEDVWSVLQSYHREPDSTRNLYKTLFYTIRNLPIDVEHSVSPLRVGLDFDNMIHIAGAPDPIEWLTGRKVVVDKDEMIERYRCDGTAPKVPAIAEFAAHLIYWSTLYDFRTQKRYNTPRFSDRHNYGGMTKNRYICKKEENQNGKTIEIYSFFQGESRRGSAQGNGASGVAGQEIWHGALENYRMEERVA